MRLLGESKSMICGFTLVEFLLYFTLTGIVVFVMSLFLFDLLRIRVKSQTIAEVEQQGRQVMQLISQTVRNAKSINAPAVGAAGNTLELGTYDSADDPTIFDLDGGTMRICEGVSCTPVSLSAANVAVSDVTFENLSRPGTLGIVRIQFTVTYVSSGGQSEYAYSKTFFGSASIRS